MRICKSCKTEKELGEFVKHKECRNGYSYTCKNCKILKQRISREINCNIHTKTYEKTINGFLMRTYRNMKSRIAGIQKKKAKLYAGKEILDKSEFYQYSLNNENFKSLYNNWILANYDRKLTPSIDRIDSKYGYTLENIQWLTHSENSRKASLYRHYEQNT